MAPGMLEAGHLCNPVATPDQLASSVSQLDGVPAELEASIIYAGARLTQIAGILLRLPQNIVAQAIVMFTRFWVGPEGGSLREFGAADVSAASLYISAKMSAHTKSPRSVINVYAYLQTLPSGFNSAEGNDPSDDAQAYFVSEGTLETKRERLIHTESAILQVLGFETRVALPHTLCVNYLQALGVFNTHRSTPLAKRAIAHLNSALLNPQLLYLTHQPTLLATAAIYLAAKEVEVKLPGCEWWECFDVDREELGFLVVAMISMEGFVRQEKDKWRSRKAPMTLAELDEELDDTRSVNGR